MACGCNKGRTAGLRAPAAGETYYALEAEDGSITTFQDLAAARAAKASDGGTVRIVRSGR